MALIDPNDPRLGFTSELKFESLWPSADSFLDGKLAEMYETSKLGQFAVLQSALQSNWDALRIALRNKATIVGDFLTDQFQVASTFKNSGAGKILQGVFANVEFGNVRSNPEQVVQSLVQVAVPPALAAVTAVPLVGTLANAYFSVGFKLAEIFSQPNSLLMPWSAYSRDSDEDLTRDFVLGFYSKEVDQTNLYRPPWNPSVAWKIGEAKDKGIVWAPFEGGAIPWRGEDGIGAIPGTQRIFGQVQLTAPGSHDPALDRIMRAPPGLTPKDLPIPWPYTKTNCGDYYPSAAATATTLYNMSSKPGSPDMYKIDTSILIDEWAAAFEALEESFETLWNMPGVLMQNIGIPNIGAARRALSEAMQPWVAWRMKATDKWQLGPPWNVPSFGGWIVPGMYSGAEIGDEYFRTSAQWIEEDKNKSSLAWPYGALPKQHHCSKHKECSSDLAATGGPDGVIHPASWKTADGPAPPGYRKIPWPTPEMKKAVYASPFTAIIKPALERLRKQQETSLKATLVCAYTRPVDLPGKPAYGAFKDPDLRQLCLDVREILLNHPIRFRVNLKDVESIDPQFAAKLKESGVTGTPADFGKSLQIKGGVSGPIEGSEQPPPGEEPQGGAPFERPDRIGRQDRSGGGGGLIIGAAAAAFFLMRR